MTAIEKISRAAFDKRLDEIRIEIESVQTEIDDIQNAPVPIVDIEPIIDELFSIKKNQFRLSNKLGSVVIGNDQHSATSAITHLFDLEGRIEGSFTHSDVTGLMLWLFGDSVKERLIESLKGLNYTAGPRLHERPKMIVKLESQLRELEIKEERLICDGESAGFQVRRRLDSDPWVLLECQEAPDEQQDSPVVNVRRETSDDLTQQ